MFSPSGFTPKSKNRQSKRGISGASKELFPSSNREGGAHKVKAAQAAWLPDEEEALLAFLSRRQATASTVAFI